MSGPLKAAKQIGALGLKPLVLTGRLSSEIAFWFGTIDQQLDTRQAQVPLGLPDRIRAGYVKHELDVAAGVIDGTLRSNEPTDNLVASQNRDRSMARWQIRHAGEIIVRGRNSEPDIFPFRATDDDIEQFLKLADCVFPGVIDAATIDPPLLPVGFSEPVFRPLKRITDEFFGNTVTPIR